MQVRSPDWEDPLEQQMATHSSILAWKIPQTEEPGGLQSMGRKESDTTEQLSIAHYMLNKTLDEFFSIIFIVKNYQK